LYFSATQTAALADFIVAQTTTSANIPVAPQVETGDAQLQRATESVKAEHSSPNDVAAKLATAESTSD
jgi:hypothetical protein